jgi:cytochrome P450
MCLQNTLKQIAAIQAGINQSHVDVAHPTIFHSIMDSKLPPEERSAGRLSDDAQVLMMAGTLTTAWTLEVCTFHLLRPENASILRRLKEEIYSAAPDAHITNESALPVLEALPYLNAVIKESLRLTYGVSGRLQRISPETAMRFNDGKREWSIPAGTPVSMTTVHVHHDESIFPDSWTFKPERWLDDNDHNLDRYLLSFTKGSRQCLGMYLAFAEMYLCLSGIWRRWGSKEVRFDDDLGILELYQTTMKDVIIQGDNFLPLVEKGSKGIRVRVLR